jgi:hypothetical protein
MVTKAYPQLKSVVEYYGKFLPINTFVMVMLSLASAVVFFAWFGGDYLFGGLPLIQRMVMQWSLSILEYPFLLLGIGGAVEVLGYSQNSISLLIHALQLTIYFILNAYTTKDKVTLKNLASFFLVFLGLLISVY